MKKMRQTPSKPHYQLLRNRDSEKKTPCPPTQVPSPGPFLASPPKKLTLGGDFFSQASSRLEALNMVFSITRLLQSNNPGWYAP